MQTISAPQPQSSSNRPLWMAVGILGIAVAAMGGTLLGMNLRDATPVQAAALQSHAVPATAAGLVPFDAPAGTTGQAPVRRANVVNPVRTASPPVRDTNPRPVAPVATQAAGCQDCGTVVSVAPVQRAAAASGVGAIAGGVVGGVVGNQVGGGSGRAVATVVGALGGGWAGNEVEKRVRTTTRYVVRVRMDHGGVRTLEQAEPVAVGSPVLVRGDVARAT